jgi:hypothetical protein
MAKLLANRIQRFQAQFTVNGLHFGHVGDKNLKLNMSPAIYGLPNVVDFVYY